MVPGWSQPNPNNMALQTLAAFTLADARVMPHWSTGAVFPSQLLLDGSKPLLATAPRLRCVLGDGRIAEARLTDASSTEVLTSDDGASTTVHVSNARWLDGEGAEIADFRTDFRFEFWRDGTTFVNFFFMGESCACPDVTSFTFEVSPAVAGEEEVLWGVISRARLTNASELLPVRSERFLEPGTDRAYDGALIANTTFDAFTPGSAALHWEFFVEGHSTLSGKADGCSSSVTWHDGVPTVRWEFQKPDYRNCHERPWQLRNQVGWLVTPPPTKRHLPPLRMYHYFSNLRRYPTDANIRKMAAAGGDIVVLHENWRADTINGGMPYDTARLRAMVDEAHANGLRVALYVRGNEQAEVEETTDWYRRFLDPAKGDGLYMDFGGAYGIRTPPYIDYVGGRIHFRGWYLASRARRERVGEEGVVFAHTGTTFSAIGMTDGLITGYVSGEGERGLMVRSRRHHAYFSKTRVIPGTMWTAAFPEYGSPAMVPFLAATGQFPHNALGSQFETSSLTHPDEPGVNDVYLRPLWKLWGLFRDERDISVGTVDNGCRSVTVDSDRTGFYLMGSADGRSHLCVLSNFDEDARDITVRFASDLVTGMTAFLLRPGADGPGQAKPIRADGEIPLRLDGLGVAGVLLVADPAAWRSRLDDFEKPYPLPDTFVSAWEAEIAMQKKLRENPPAWREVWLRISVPNLATPYEESLWWDLYANQVELVRRDGTGGAGASSLGWIVPGSATLAPERPLSDPKVPPVPGTNDAGIVWPGHASEWIPLHAILSPGEHRLALRTVIATRGISTYSFLQATLSPEPREDAPGAYTLLFRNALEPDREFIRWTTRLAAQEN